MVEEFSFDLKGNPKSGVALSKGILRLVLRIYLLQTAEQRGEYGS